MTRNALVVREQNKLVSATEDGLALIRRMFAAGHNQSSVATALGISRSSFGHLRKRDERVQEAYEEGLGAFEYEMVEYLAKAAEKGNVAAAMFLLKTRCGYRENGDPSEVAPRSNVIINLPASIPMEEYRKAIDVRIEE